MRAPGEVIVRHHAYDRIAEADQEPSKREPVHVAIDAAADRVRNGGILRERRLMIAIGCLAPLILAVAGVLGGHLAAGSEGALWGGGIGAAAGAVILAAFGWLAGRLKE